MIMIMSILSLYTMVCLVGRWCFLSDEGGSKIFECLGLGEEKIFFLKVGSLKNLATKTFLLSAPPPRP
jgi:hypothetical protein